MNSGSAAVYRDDSLTQSTAGVSLLTNFDSISGFNQITITTTSDGAFYTNGSDYTVVLTGGTVSSKNVAGYVLGAFSLQNRTALRPATAGRTITVDSSGSVMASGGAASDPWITSLPGAYAPGSAGRIVGDNLNVPTQYVADLVEYNRGHHTVTGSVFYVDGTGGNDANAGTRAAPKLTISAALALCTSNAHDLVILLPNAAGGPTTITESATISVTKNYVQIRGPGRDVNVTQTAAANRDVFNITANGVELSGFRITTNGNTSNGVTISGTADFVRLYRLWIESAHQDAVHFNVATRGEVTHCFLVGSGRDGVRISSGAGAGTYNVIADCVIRDSVGSAANLQGADASECRIQRNVIRDNAVGITISAGTADTIITDNRFINNTATISDAGTRTLQAWNFLSSGTDGLVGIDLDDTTGALGTAQFDANYLTANLLATDAVNEIADATLDRTNAIETGLTLRQALRIISTSVAGELSGAGTTTITIRNAIADDKNRIIATVDSLGNRQSIVYDLSD